VIGGKNLKPKKSSSKHITFLILLSILLFGCQFGKKQTIDHTATPVPPTSTSTITSTPTVEPSPTPTSTPDIQIEFRPLNEIESISQFSEISGKIALLRAQRRVLRGLLLLELPSMEVKTILEGSDIYASVSPENDLIAYSDYETNIMTISNAGGEVLEKYINSYNYPYSMWLSENILMTKSTNKKYPIFLYSLIEERQTEIPQFVDMTEYESYFDWDIAYGWGFYCDHKNVYDPNFELVLYPDFSDNDLRQISLMDMESREILGTYPTYHLWGRNPTWSPNAEKLAIGLETPGKLSGYQQEISFLKRDGTIEYTTILGNLYDQRYIQGMAWSSNSRYLAFFFSTSERPYENLNITILDTYNKTYISFGEFITDNYYQLFWSPDNKYLLIQKSETNVPEEKFIPAIIEVETGNIIYLEENYDIAGWLK
jgi:hypothetical protein